MKCVTTAFTKDKPKSNQCFGKESNKPSNTCTNFQITSDLNMDVEIGNKANIPNYQFRTTTTTTKRYKTLSY